MGTQRGDLRGLTKGTKETATPLRGFFISEKGRAKANAFLKNAHVMDSSKFRAFVSTFGSDRRDRRRKIPACG